MTHFALYNKNLEGYNAGYADTSFNQLLGDAVTYIEGLGDKEVEIEPKDYFTYLNNQNFEIKQVSKSAYERILACTNYHQILTEKECGGQEVKIFGRLGVTILISKEIIQKVSKETGDNKLAFQEGIKEAFAAKRVIYDDDSYIIGNSIAEAIEEGKVTIFDFVEKGERENVSEGDFYIFDSGLDICILNDEMSYKREGNGDDYYSVWARLGFETFINVEELRKEGIDKAITTAFNRNEFEHSGDSYFPEDCNYNDGDDEILSVLKEEWDISELIPSDWRFKNE